MLDHVKTMFFIAHYDLFVGWEVKPKKVRQIKTTLKSDIELTLETKICLIDSTFQEILEYVKITFFCY